MTPEQNGQPATTRNVPSQSNGGTSEALRQGLQDFEADDPKDELLLEQVFKTLDHIDALEQEVASRGHVIENARGTVMANPALQQVARQRDILTRLLRELFPSMSPGSVSGRRAVQARWGRHR